MDASIVNIITQTAQKYGVAPWVALDIAQEESGGDPNNVGDNGTSFGLFQLHYGGQGDGYSVAQLKDPTLNADVGIKNIASSYQAGVAQGLQGWQLLDYTATTSGHPGYGGPGAYPSYENALAAVYNSSGFTSTAGPPAPTGGASSSGASTVSGVNLTNAPVSTPSGTDVLGILDEALKIKNFNILQPMQSITQDAGALALRAFLFIVGIIIIIFGLLRIAK